MIRICLIALTLNVSSFWILSAQSFEGTMHASIAGKDIRLFIWMDLEIEKKSVQGSYFYKTIGNILELSGTMDGKQLVLKETDKLQNTTGIFSCVLTNNKLSGIWVKPDKSDTLQVELYRTNPSFRSSARLPRISNLLAEDIEFYSAGLSGEYSEEAVNYSVLFARCNLLCMELNWENYSYTAHYGTNHYTYDLSLGEMIDLKQSVNDRGLSYLVNALQDIVTTNRSEYSDDEWIEGLQPYVEDFEYGDTSIQYQVAALEKINELFSVSIIPERAEFYLDDNGLNCFILDYCEQYYSTGNRGMTFHCLVTVPFDKLKSYIRKDSILENLYNYK